MRFNAVFAGFIQGYIFSPQKSLLSFSPIRPHSKVNHFPNRARLISYQSNNPFTRFTASSFLRLMILAYTCVIFTSVWPSNFEVV